MASDKQTMDLHKRRMVISANPKKGYKRQFYSLVQANEKPPARTLGFQNSVVTRGGIEPPTQGFSTLSQNNYLNLLNFSLVLVVSILFFKTKVAIVAATLF